MRCLDFLRLQTQLENYLVSKVVLKEHDQMLFLPKGGGFDVKLQQRFC